MAGHSLHERFEEISLPAYSQVGAPRVGTDSVADAWVLWRVRCRTNADADPPFTPDEPSASEPRTEEEREALKEMAGYYVLELAPPCAGLPRYTMGAFGGGADLTSFRGKFLHDCEDILGEELLARAYENQTPDELVDYGAKLLELARAFAEERGCAHVEQQEEPPDHDTDESRAHILFAAARWCSYWGHRGHYLEAWH
jgi:hypothetical protein